MNPWARRIEEFAKLPHKNISVRIQNTTPEEIETVLDAIAKDHDWTYKEIEEKNSRKLIRYQTDWVIPTTSLSLLEHLSVHLTLMFKSLTSQIIDYVFISDGDTVRLNIESRYFATKNKATLFLYFLLYFLYAPAALFTNSGKNSDNIQYVLSGLQMYFKDRVTVLDKIQDSHFN